MHRKKLILSTLFTASLLFTFSTAVAEEDQTSWLFAQTASGFDLVGKTLTIPYEREIFAFSDRPNRIHDYLNATEFQSMWQVGENNFSSNPPNAVLTWVADGEIQEAEIELVGASVGEQGRVMIYDIDFETGLSIPATASQVSLFIDGWETEDGQYCEWLWGVDDPVCVPIKKSQ